MWNLGNTVGLSLTLLACASPAHADSSPPFRTVAQFIADCSRSTAGVACTFPIYILWQDSAICKDPGKHDHICPPKSSQTDKDAAEEHAGVVAQWLRYHPELSSRSDHDGIIEATKALFPCRKE